MFRWYCALKGRESQEQRTAEIKRNLKFQEVWCELDTENPQRLLKIEFKTTLL